MALGMTFFFYFFCFFFCFLGDDFALSRTVIIHQLWSCYVAYNLCQLTSSQTPAKCRVLVTFLTGRVPSWRWSIAQPLEYLARVELGGASKWCASKPKHFTLITELHIELFPKIYHAIWQNVPNRGRSLTSVSTYTYRIVGLYSYIFY